MLFSSFVFIIVFVDFRFLFSGCLFFALHTNFFTLNSICFLLLQKSSHTRKMYWNVFFEEKNCSRCIQSKHKNDLKTFVCCCCCCLSCVFEQKLLIGSFSSFVYIVLRFAAFFSLSTIYSIHTTQHRKFISCKKASRSMNLSVGGRTKCPLAAEWQFFDGIRFVEMSNTKLFHTQILNQKRNNLITSLRTAIFDSVLNTGSSAHCELCERYSFFFFKCTLAYDCCVFFSLPLYFVRL